MLPGLRALFLRHRARLGPVAGTELGFRPLRGGPRTKDNIRLRILAPVLVRARPLLEERGAASLLFAIGEDPVSVMRQLGQTDPAFTLRVYAHSMGGRADERERLRAIADGCQVIGEVSVFAGHGVPNAFRVN
jgi:hypothetical protein